MKARIPHPFLTFASRFSKESMAKMISKIAFEVFNNKNSQNRFVLLKDCDYEGNIFKNVKITQTYLVDLMYEIVCLKNTGKEEIDDNSLICLILLYSDYLNEYETKTYNKKDTILRVLSFVGEQILFQNQSILKNDLERENYILTNDLFFKNNVMDLERIIINETGFSSSIHFDLLWVMCSHFLINNPIIDKTIKVDFRNPAINKESLFKVLDYYSIDMDAISKSPLKRQLFYSKPLLKYDTEYICINPNLILSAVAHSHYWIIRNYYKQINSQDFINYFGSLFENYVKSIFKNVLLKSEYTKIPEGDCPSADWLLDLDGIKILIEQKSSISSIEIKQSQPNLNQLLSYMQKTWKKAICQLNSSQATLKLESPIKIILLYEGYYLSETLDQLFKYDNSISDDRKYWLVNINEFEMLMGIYQHDKELFKRIILEKDCMEKEKSNKGRSLLQIMNRHGIWENTYLDSFGISRTLESVIEDLKQES